MSRVFSNSYLNQWAASSPDDVSSPTYEVEFTDMSPADDTASLPVAVNTGSLPVQNCLLTNQNQSMSGLTIGYFEDFNH